MLHSPTTKPVASCFICGSEVPQADLSSHEKACLDNIQSNDVQYTRQITDENSSISSPRDQSNTSIHSFSSGDSSEKKHVRCYICGSDVPTYLTSIHEKNCKKSWESGLLNSISTPARKASSKGDLNRSLSRGCTDLSHNSQTGGLRKSKSVSHINTGDAFIARKIIDASGDGKNENKPSKINSTFKRKNCIPRSSEPRAYNPTWMKSKSLQDIRGIGLKSDEKKKTNANPQYVVCQNCGKLYSMHSIPIHQRQCDRNRMLQRNAGTEVEYKKKSKSLADLSSRPSSASNNSMTRNRPSSSAKSSISKECPSSDIKKQLKTQRPLTAVSSVDRGIKIKRPSSAVSARNNERVKKPLDNCNVNDVSKEKLSSALSIKRVLNVNSKEKPTTAKPTRESSSTSNQEDSLNSSVGTIPFYDSLDSSIMSVNDIDQPQDSIDGSKIIINGIDQSRDSIGDSSISINGIDQSRDSIDNSNISDGKEDKTKARLQKCYLCGQIYGSRSLPIHEKQCLKKWERNCKDEKEKKKTMKQREIIILPFGKLTSKSNSLSSPPMSSPLPQSSPHLSPSSYMSLSSPPISPLHVFEVEPIKQSTPVSNSPSFPTSQKFKRNLLKNHVQSIVNDIGLTTDDSTPNKPNTLNKPNTPKFQLCIYCNRQYGQHSIDIHQKGCRDRKVIEDGIRQRLDSASKNKKMALSKSLGDLSMTNNFVNGDVNNLVKCSDCQRKFLSSDIDKHRLFCRVVIL